MSIFREVNRSHYYRDIEVEGDPIVEAIEELREDVGEIRTDITEVNGRVDGVETYINNEILPHINVCEWAFVKEYGAVGDGVTDDTAAINAALHSGKKYIGFNSGTYLVSTANVNQVALRVPSNTRVVGFGAKLVCYSPQAVVITNDADGVTGGYEANTNITIEGLTIQATTSTRLTMIGFAHCNNITIRDCHFKDLLDWHFIELNGIRNAVVDGCSFENNLSTEMVQLDIMTAEGIFPWYGPYDNTMCVDVTINGCKFANTAAIFNSKGPNVLPCGIGNHNWLASGGYINGVTISNCKFLNLQSAMKFKSGHNFTITGNVAQNCNSFFSAPNSDDPEQLAGIVITGNCATGKMWESGSQGSSIQSGIWFEGKNNVIEGNQIYGFSHHGIWLMGENNLIEGNKVGECGRAGIYLNKASVYNVSGNHCVNNYRRNFAGHDADITMYSTSDKKIDNTVVSNNFCSKAYLHNAIAGASGNTFINNTIPRGVTREDNDRTNYHNNLVSGVWTA